MKRLGLIMVLGLALAGCTRTPKPVTPVPAASKRIVYESGPCFGACPVFKIELFGNNSGRFTGIRHTAVIGEATFPVTPAQYAAFAGALAPYRPKGERRIAPGSPECGRAATDMPSTEVRWGEGKSADRLYLYFGCDRERYRAMADALGNAPDLLPLTLLLGERP
jgi:hypothetical protein